MLCSFLQTISSKPEVCNLGWFSPKWQLAMSGDRFDCQRWGKEYLRPWVDGGPGCCKASYNEQDDPLHGPQTCRDKRAFITQWSSEPCRAGPPKSDGSQWRVLAKRGPLEEGRAAHCLEKSMNSMKRQRDMTPEDESPRLKGVQNDTGEEWRVLTASPRKNETAVQSGTDAQVWMCLVLREKSDVVKNSTA